MKFFAPTHICVQNVINSIYINQDVCNLIKNKANQNNQIIQNGNVS